MILEVVQGIIGDRKPFKPTTPLTGNGTSATPLKIAQQAATNGQVLNGMEYHGCPEMTLVGEQQSLGNTNCAN